MQIKSSTEKKRKQVFVNGPVSPGFIAESIAKHGSKMNIGAHDIFLGQVRSDHIDHKKVAAIEYSCYKEMAEKELSRIREQAFKRFGLECLHIYHSLNIVKAGEICLFVFSSAPHRKSAFGATKFVVEEIKTSVPIFGKEIFEDESHQWKINNT